MTRRRALVGARWAFVLLTVVGAWTGFRGRWSDIGAALADIGVLRLVPAVALAAAGLVLTSLLWRLLLRWLGSGVPVREGTEVFLVGQLGKYVPGSVWSLAVQAQLGRRHAVPVRTSITASTLFLLVHTATGLLLGGALVLAGVLGATPRQNDDAWALAAGLAGAVALLPPLLRRMGDRLAASGHRTTYGVRELGLCVGLMAAVWACYGASLLVLMPAQTSPLAVVAAFAVAHAAGVLVVLAPAGVGAREAVLVALLAPSVGVPAAAAAAVLSRLAHVLADFGVAAAATGWARGGSSADAREPARVRGR